MAYPKMNADIKNVLQPKPKPRPKPMSALFVLPKKATAGKKRGKK